MKVRIDRLATDSDCRLLWLGHPVRDRDPQSIGYLVTVYFENRETKEVVSVLRPLDELPLFCLQSRWCHGEHVANGGDLGEFVVYPQPLSEAKHPWRGNPPLLTPKDYFFHKKPELLRCFTFATDGGPDIVVPTWQILRAWYFRPSTLPAILAGMLDINTDYQSKYQPWRRGTYWNGRHFEYHVPPTVSEAEAKAFARLLMDPLARRQAQRIHALLMKSHGSPYLAEVLPPHESPALWRVRYKPISAGESGRPRVLALDLIGCKIPSPFDTFRAVTEELHGDSAASRESLAVHATRRGARPEEPTGALGRQAANPNIPRSALDGFAFEDETLDAVEVTRQTISVSSPGHRKSTRVATDESLQSTMSTSGRPSGNHALLVPDKEYVPPLHPDDMLYRTKAGFTLAAERCKHRSEVGSRWDGELIRNSEQGTLVAGGIQRRHFVVLQLRRNEKAVYAIDAQRFTKEQFALIFCRRIDFSLIRMSEFARWFGEFTGEWETSEGMPTNLSAIVAAPHQTQRIPRRIADLPEHQRGPQGEKHYIEGLASRLERRLTAYLDGSIDA